MEHTRMRRLRPRELRFVEQYILGNDAGRAATAAGYGNENARAMGASLLADDAIRAEIARRMALVSLDAKQLREALTAKLTTIATLARGQLLEFDEAGAAKVWLDEATPEQLDAIEEIVSETINTVGGPVLRTKVKFADSLKAADMLAKMYGFYAADRLELSGADGAPVAIADVTKVDATTAVQSYLAVMKGRK